MANRDQPVNGKGSKLTLREAGDLLLTDPGRTTVWTAGTFSLKPVQLHLNDSGNAVLLAVDGVVLWQSFDSPTDTILTNQPFTRNVKLVSSRSQSNFSSGFYKLFFDGYDVLRLIFESNALSSLYWPPQWAMPWDVGRVAYNQSTFAWLDPSGYFDSSDNFNFTSEDYGSRLIQRRLKLDYDGNILLYSRKSLGDRWVVSWQTFHNPCKIHGICGTNSLCTYDHNIGRKCSCLPGHKMKNRGDWSYGCEPDFNLSCDKSESAFLKLSHSEFYGYDLLSSPNYTFKDCQNLCLKRCECKGFEYSFSYDEGYYCYTKTLLANGYQVPSYSGDTYMRLPKNHQLSREEFKLNCSDQVVKHEEIKSHENQSVRFILWFAIGIGGLEILSILVVWCLLIRTQKDAVTDARSHILATTRFIRFSFAELKKATRGFAQEIGRGSEGIVYKGILSDSRVAAVKRLNKASCQGEAEFLAELSTIGRLNHMNLIEMWGYCAEGNHRLLVYEYLEYGSLKENLSRNVLDWKKRFEIAVGTAKGLAYLHEECLEWILHCDVKPQNILLTSNYQPKVADFGLSKLLKRGELNKPSFSRIRGTRGYMAPEWVTNQSITSKVDVYSYGVVLLEILTGKSPTDSNSSEEKEHRGVVKWVKEMVIDGSSETASWVEKIMDPSMEGDYDVEKMENLLRAALECVREDKDERPSMSQVVKALSLARNYGL
ncbi:Putative receptor protein kinase ZmPK1 [Morus notabilis]|uniref:Receptor-like serine/threonine-protein kinase n=1 Tax=Morus notabilis TaxID=981085 RepID=W9RP60_9ROSA|nr:Putative receptor protein kinase ZmPK1 [Morus notabilis]